MGRKYCLIFKIYETPFLCGQKKKFGTQLVWPSKIAGTQFVFENIAFQNVKYFFIYILIPSPRE